MMIASNSLFAPRRTSAEPKLKTWMQAKSAAEAAVVMNSRIFTRFTGFTDLDDAVARLHANKDELLLVLDRPEIPLHTNGSENAVRSFVTKRRISGETRSAAGKQARDTFLSLLKTCSKLAISFWDYLGARLKIPDADRVPWLPDLIRQNASA